MTEIMHSEERRENECRNANGTFEGHHTNTRVMGMLEERKEKKKTQKNIQRNNGRKLPEFDEKHYSTHP